MIIQEVVYSLASCFKGRDCWKEPQTSHFYLCLLLTALLHGQCVGTEHLNLKNIKSIAHRVCKKNTIEVPICQTLKMVSLHWYE